MSSEFFVMIKPEAGSRTYLLASSYCTVMGKASYTNETETKLKCRCLSFSEAGMIFEISILDHKQTNENGLNALVENMNLLKEKIIFQTDETGAITSVLNKYEILDKWELQKPVIRKKLKNDPRQDMVLKGIEDVLIEDDSIEFVFMNSPVYNLLMPGIYQKYQFNKAIPGKKSIYNFLANENLPLETQTTFTKYDALFCITEIRRTGELQKETSSCDFDKIAAIMKNMMDMPDFKTKVYARYQEVFDLDEEYRIKFAGQIINCGIEKAYMNQTVSHLKMLKE
jgi:hypothetical protein